MFDLKLIYHQESSFKIYFYLNIFLYQIKKLSEFIN